MYKKSQNRTPKAKSLRLKHVVQTCLLIIFSGWVLYELKLLLIKVNSRKTNLISSNASQTMPRHIASRQTNMTSKSLIRVATEVVSSRGDARNEDDEKGEGGERSVHKMDLSNDRIISQAQTVEDTKKNLESSLKSGTEQYESFDYPESTSEHESKEDSFDFDVEISEETTRTREVVQEDAY